jgi:hypothetical protein
MGVSNSTTGGRRTYLNISKGKIAMRQGTGIELFDNLSGMLTSITIHEGKFGKELHLGINDNGDEFLLQMKFDSGYARGFMMAVKNADLKAPMVLAPKHEVVGDKQKATLFVNQFGKGLKWFWSKDNPGDLPQMTSREWKGKIEWDNTAQLAYLENMLLTEIVPQLVHPAVAGGAQGEAPQPKYMKEQPKLADMPEDDLPF